jgi:hypothetical protein
MGANGWKDLRQERGQRSSRVSEAWRPLLVSAEQVYGSPNLAMSEQTASPDLFASIRSIALCQFVERYCA